MVARRQGQFSTRVIKSMISSLTYDDSASDQYRRLELHVSQCSSLGWLEREESLYFESALDEAL